MPNSRLFTKAAFDHAERPLLIHQGGSFYDWDGTCWPELDEATLRTQQYTYFEHAVYWHETKNGPELRPYGRWRFAHYSRQTIRYGKVICVGLKLARGSDPY